MLVRVIIPRRVQSSQESANTVQKCGVLTNRLYCTPHCRPLQKRGNWLLAAALQHCSTAATGEYIWCGDCTPAERRCTNNIILMQIIHFTILTLRWLQTHCHCGRALVLGCYIVLRGKSRWWGIRSMLIRSCFVIFCYYSTLVSSIWPTN